jgi:hypothetical protein
MLHIGLGVLGLLAAVIVVLGTIGPGLIVNYLEGDAEPLTILTIIGVSVGGFLILISLPGIVGGFGLLKLQSWARYLVMVLGVLNLVNLPIGTAIGLYTLWALMQPETEELFTKETGVLATA